MDSMFNRGTLPALEAVLRFTNVRHKAIAQNIANAETPGYRARDVSVPEFRKALARAFQEQKSAPTGVFEMGRLPLRIGPAGESGIVRSTGNNVDIDIEMGRMVKNAQLHNLAATLLAHQFAQLRTAVSERIA